MFWWNVLLNLTRQRKPQPKDRRVSILVLVECTSEFCDLKVVGFRIFLFQSLFWWNVLLNSLSGRSRSHVLPFQSLFWWNVLLKQDGVLLVAFTRTVSILVLVECTSEFTCRWMAEQRAFRFQSLFWWNVLLNSLRALVAGLLPSVSILVLVECTSETEKLRSGRTRPRLFQSLFWWNVLLNTTPRPSILDRRCFNPCSGGMYF